MRILVLDDDEAIREIIGRVLAGDGRTIDTAGSCAGAFDLVYAHRYDIVTIDLNLPDGCGLDVLERIRRDGSCARAIVVSGDVRNAMHAKRAQRLQAHALLEKPFDWKELRRLALGSEEAASPATANRDGKALRESGRHE